MILITGANGQLGKAFQAIAARFPALECVFADSKTLDIGDRKAVEAYFKKIQPRWCINCAAYTAVDKAESEPEAAKRVNADGARHLAQACAKVGAPLIHFSSDYVYHNGLNRPLLETDPTRPQSVYARTKRAGERAALKAQPLTMILRCSWVYAPWGNNFVKTMLRLGAERPELRVVFDQIGTPTYAPDLAETVLQLIQRVENGTLEQNALAGIWHYSNEGVCSWYDFAAAIFEQRQLPCRLLPIETREYPTPASRPPYSVMNKAKIKQAFGIDIPHWRASLLRCLAEMS